MLVRDLLLLCFLGVALGYRPFQDQLPNGDVVPHPCKPNFIWRGVGHINPRGGGDTNQFGKDFVNYGKTWNERLCRMDSDGDGISNGMELGDPDCEWTPGKGHFPKRTTSITHPGVCDPFNSEKCRQRNKGISCETDTFVCPEIHKSHVKNMTLRIPRTNVPAQETTYMCMSFDIEFPPGDTADQDYHLIATQAYIDNPNVMHHLSVYGCDDTAKKLDKPEECYMAQEGCNQLMGLWTLGMPGECFYKDAGFLFGRQKTKRLMFQYHWTNPMLKTDYYDSSGMILYYTKQLRKYNAGVLVTGQSRLEIPPGQPRVVKDAMCPSKCTKHMLKGNIHMTRGLNHMHYLGYQQNVELFRDGHKVQDLINDPIYSYDSPVMHIYNDPVVIMPGDEIKTTCVYRSPSKTRTTFMGEGTYDEMCYGIMNVFPIENMTKADCVSWGSLSQCGVGIDWGKCDVATFSNHSHPETMKMRKMILDNCNFYGGCRPECKAAVAKARKNPCLQGEIGEYLMWGQTWSHERDDSRFLSALTSCDCHMTNGQGHFHDHDHDHSGVVMSNAKTVLSSSFVLLILTILSLL